MSCNIPCSEIYDWMASIPAPILGVLSIFLIAGFFNFLSYCIFDPEEKCLRVNSMTTIDEIEKYLIQNSIYLRKSPAKPIPRMVDFVIGNWNVFNNVNNLNTKIFIKTILLVCHFTIIYFVFRSGHDQSEDDIGSEAIVALTAAFPVIFWHHHAVFYNKWKHCSDFLHKYLLSGLERPTANYEVHAYLRDRDLEEREEKFNESFAQMEHTILIDLIHLDLWAHKSFYRSFNHILFEKIKTEYKNDEVKAFTLLKEIAQGKWSEADVEYFLRKEWYLKESPF